MDDRMGQTMKPVESSVETLMVSGGFGGNEECATMTRKELIVRICDLESEACRLQQLICHLLQKNETLRQELYWHLPDESRHSSE
jgi:hypothetical protein